MLTGVLLCLYQNFSSILGRLCLGSYYDFTQVLLGFESDRTKASTKTALGCYKDLTIIVARIVLRSY